MAEGTAGASAIIEQLLQELGAAGEAEALQLLRRFEAPLLETASNGERLLFLQDHANPRVRVWLVRFLRGLCERHESQLPLVLDTYQNIMHACLGDSELVSVIKAVISSCSLSVFSSTFSALLATTWEHGEGGEQARAACWAALQRLKARVLQCLESSSDGVRLQAIKFTEVLAWLCSETVEGDAKAARAGQFTLDQLPDDASGVPQPLYRAGFSRVGLSEEAAALVDSLCSKLRDLVANMFRTLRSGSANERNSSSMRYTNQIAILNSLARIGRYKFRVHGSRIANLLCGLPQYIGQLQPTSHVYSIAHSLRYALFALMRSGQWEGSGRPLIQALAKLDAREQAEQLWARIQKKRPREEAAGLSGAPPAKRRRTADQAQAGLKVVLDMVLANLGRMVQHPGPGVAQALAPGHSPGVEQVNQALQQLAPLQQALGMTPVLAVPVPEAKGQPADPRAKRPAAVPAPTDSFTAVPSMQQLSSMMDTTAAAPATPSRPAPVLELLTPERCKAMGQSALMRILRAEAGARRAGKQELQVGVLARLLLHQSLRHSRLDEVVQHILEDFGRRRQLALQWLYMEFVGSWKEGEKKSEAKERGSRYHSILLLLLAGLHMRPSSVEADQQLRQFLIEVPVVADSVFSVLDQLNDAFAAHRADEKKAEEEMGEEEKEAAGGEKRTPVGLAVLHDLICLRPTYRKESLARLLAYTAHANEALRGFAILVVAQELFAARRFSEEILDFTQKQMAELASVGRGEEGEEAGEEAKRRIQLFCRLCTIDNHRVLMAFENFPAYSAEVQAQVCVSLKELLRSMGQRSPVMQEVMEQFPSGAEPLVLVMLKAVTEEEPPSMELVQLVQRTYDNKLAKTHAELLVPVLPGLTGQQVRSLLPTLVSLPGSYPGEAVKLILAFGNSLSPPELLVELHRIEKEVSLQQQMDVVQVCLEHPAYERTVMAVVLQQLLALSPLPTLLMRTVLQSLARYPGLKEFVATSVLTVLVQKQVWGLEQLWDGFVKCCLLTAPHCYPVILQVPSDALEDLVKKEARLAPPLLAYLKRVPDASPALMAVLTAAVPPAAPAAAPAEAPAAAVPEGGQ